MENYSSIKRIKYWQTCCNMIEPRKYAQEENRRMGKTRDLLKKIRDIREHFM